MKWRLSRFMWLCAVLAGFQVSAPGSALSQEGHAEIFIDTQSLGDSFTFLKGPWEVYQKNRAGLDSPVSPVKLDPESTDQLNIIYFPKTFKSIHGSSGQGFYVFRTLLRFDRKVDDYEIFVPSGLAALRLSINGSVIYEQGQVGFGREDEVATRGYSRVPLPPGQVFEIKLEMSNFTHRNGGLRSSISIGPRTAIWAMDRHNLIMLAFVIGALLIVAVYHLALYVYRPHDRAHLFLVLLCLGIALRSSQSGNPRLVIEILQGLDFTLSMRLEYFGLVMSVAAFHSYYESIFPKLVPKYLMWASQALSGIFAVLILSTDVMFFTGLLPFYQIQIILMMSYAFILLFKAIKQKRPAAVDFSVGAGIFLCFALAEVFFLLMSRNYPLSFWGTFLLVLSQSVALARRFSLEFNELKFYQRQTRHAYNEIRKIFYPHQLKMLQKGVEIEKTMPIGNGKAAVICLDIIDSSSLPIDNLKKKELIQKLFGSCYNIMFENYRQNPMSANAYRIKEMGDGFLCSIGFPFENPTEKNNETLAVELAIRFVNVLNSLVDELEIENPVYCSMGIATGDIEAFFAESGIKDYDLMGRPLILATRYERVRNILFRDFAKQSVIALQDEVYEALSPNLQSHFQSFDLGDETFRIRDDARARQFHYCFVNDWLCDYLVLESA